MCENSKILEAKGIILQTGAYKVTEPPCLLHLFIWFPPQNHFVIPPDL